MHKNNYTFGILFLSLLMLMNFFLSIIQWQIGPRIFTLDSFLPWYGCGAVVYFMATGIVLKYYYYKKYRLVFATLVITTIAMVIQYFVVFNILFFSEFSGIYFKSYSFALVTGLLYSGSLIFSQSSQRPMLKLAGILASIFGIFLLITLIWFLNTKDYYFKGTLEKIHQLTATFDVFISLFFILNFRQERRNIQPELFNTTWKRSWNKLMAVICLIALGTTVFLGQRVFRQSRIATAPHVVTEKSRAIASLYEARYYVNSEGDSLRYRLMKPLNYDSEKKYPLMVLLHHGGAHGTDNVNQIEGSFAPLFYNYLNREKYPAFLFIPQCSQQRGWADPLVDMLTVETIRSLENTFSIDTNRRYIMGQSGGGYGSWHFIGSHPGMFAAAVPICGAGDTKLAKNMLDVAVWAFHGELDQLAPVSGSREMIAAIRKEGGNPKYTEYPGADHYIGQKVENTPGLLDWLFEQRRK